MPRKVVMMDCLLQMLSNPHYSDLIYYIDKEETTFQIKYQHGNKRQKNMSQLEAAKVWLYWDEQKNRVPNWKAMTPENIGKYLTTVRQRFRQGLKSLQTRGLLAKIPTGDTHLEEYRITTDEERRLHLQNNKKERKNSTASSLSDPPSPASSSSACSSVGSPQVVPDSPDQNYDVSDGNDVSQQFDNVNNVLCYVTSDAQPLAIEKFETEGFHPNPSTVALNSQVEMDSTWNDEQDVDLSKIETLIFSHLQEMYDTESDSECFFAELLPMGCH